MDIENEVEDDMMGGQAPVPAANQVNPELAKIGETLTQWANMPNIVGELSLDRVRSLGQECFHGYEIDLRSRTDWERQTRKFMAIALQKTTPKSFPWPNASNIIWPLLSQAVNEFAAATYPAIFDGDQIVKGKVVGTDDGQVDQQAMAQQAQQMQIAAMTTPQMPGQEPQQPMQPPEPPKPVYIQGQEPGSKQSRASRVSRHMSYQLLTEQDEWEADTDMLLRALPVIGCAARKSWFDPIWGRNKSSYVSMLDLVVNFSAKSLGSAPRVTEEYELYPYEIEEMIRSGQFAEFAYGTASTQEAKTSDYMGDKYAPHIFLEQHCFVDLDEDGYPEPYVVTIHKSSQTVVRITARYEVDGIHTSQDKSRIAKIDAIEYYTLYQFMPNPESAIYGHGFGHILGPINQSINSALNQMFDAGTLQTVQGGFVGAGVSLHTGALRFKMGEFKPIQTTGMNLREAFWQPDFKGPSEVMFRMFGLLVEAGRELAGIKDIGSGSVPPASTDPMAMMAMMETGMRVFKDVFKRVWRAMKSEFRKLFDLNRRYLPEQPIRWQRGDVFFEVSREDYTNTAGVEPVGDPNMVTDMQRTMRAQFLLAFKDDPRCNGVEIIRRGMQAMNIEDIDKIVIKDPPPNPMMLLEMQLKQAELASALATQQKDRAQSILYLMQARKAASEADAIPIEAQLEREWQAIERTNTELSAISTAISASKVKVDEMKARKTAK